MAKDAMEVEEVAKVMPKIKACDDPEAEGAFQRLSLLRFRMTRYASFKFVAHQYDSVQYATRRFTQCRQPGGLHSFFKLSLQECFGSKLLLRRQEHAAAFFLFMIMSFT